MYIVTIVLVSCIFDERSRPNSDSFLEHVAVRLSEDNHMMLYVPEGCAHGFQTLEDNTEVFYQMSEFYEPEYARGVRWNDPAFNITWPAKISVISEKDKHYSNYSS